MKILQVTPSFLPNRGGVETHVLESSLELVSMGHEVVVMTAGSKNQGLETEIIKGIEIIRLPILENNKNKLSKTLVFSEIKKQIDLFITVDIVQAHDVFWWLLPIWPKIRHKIFTTFHGWEGQYPVKNSHKLHRLLAAKLSKGTIHVGDWIKKFYWDKPDFVTYGGTKSRSSKRNKEINPNKTLNCVFFGRLSKENEIEKYIDLIKLMKAKRYGWQVKMTWVGDGVFAEQCSKLGKVTGMTGSYVKYLNAADFVFANSYLSMLDSLERGNIVCSFYSNPLKKAYLESFPAKKWLLIAEKPHKMLKNIEILLKNPKKLQENIKKSQQFAQNQTWNKVSGVYLKLWK